MNEAVKQLAEVLNGPHTGTFKVTRRLAEELGLEGHRDFSRLDGTTDLYIRPDASEFWQKEFARNEIKENTSLYGIREITKGRVFKSTTPVLTVIGYPARYNAMPQGRDYSVDERQGRGTAHFAVDLVMDKKTAPRIAEILQADPTVLNESLAMTEWSYNGIRFNPYQYFIAKDEPSAEQAKDIVSGNLRLTGNPDRAFLQLPVFKVQELHI